LIWYFPLRDFVLLVTEAGVMAEHKKSIGFEELIAHFEEEEQGQAL